MTRETLRLYPPIHIGNRKAAHDVHLPAGTIPAGNRVMYSIYLSHRDPAQWENPDAFDPDRFDRQAAVPAFTYVPFGGGPRNCIGATFAQIEAKVVMARLFQRTRLDLVPGQQIHAHMGATLEPRPGRKNESNQAAMTQPVPVPPVQIEDLRKVYRVPVREAGVGAALRSMVKRETKDIVAVGGISFAVAPGEVVGFLGPNGAGKTTTLKMASGLLHPSGGSVRVLGFEPWRRQKEFLSQITLVMGNRNQLEWDIPCQDSYDLLAAVYRVPEDQYRQTLANLTELLDLGPLLSKPVRNLSLGERMKCEIAGALLHRPQVLFLDEPTIGLDVTMQRRIRAFLQDYNQLTGSTILLTSHYMADVEALCKRVVVIHHGRLLYDGELGGLVSQFSAYKTIAVDLANGPSDIPAGGLDAYGETIEQDGGRVKLRVRKQDTAAVTGRLLADLPIVDLTVEDPPIEEVIEKVFASEP